MLVAVVQLGLQDRVRHRLNAVADVGLGPFRCEVVDDAAHVKRNELRVVGKEPVQPVIVQDVQEDKLVAMRVGDVSRISVIPPAAGEAETAVESPTDQLHVLRRGDREPVGRGVFSIDSCRQLTDGGSDVRDPSSLVGRKNGRCITSCSLIHAEDKYSFRLNFGRLVSRLHQHQAQRWDAS